VRLVLALRERGRPFIKTIDDSLKIAQHLSTTLEDKVLDDLVQDPSNYTSKIEAWALNGQDRCGFEKHKKKVPWRMIVDHQDDIINLG
jgi:hypothetical protein